MRTRPSVRFALSGGMGLALCRLCLACQVRKDDSKYAKGSFKSGRTTRRRSSVVRRANQVARAGETAVLMQAEMWLMPVSEFVKLQTLRPHQDLLAEGKLTRWDSSMTSVFFLSHQWTSFDHPDHTLQQLRSMQRLITRMITGQCPETVPSFMEAIRLPKNFRITSAQWQKIAEKAFIWVDFFSVRARYERE